MSVQGDASKLSSIICLALLLLILEGESSAVADLPPLPQNTHTQNQNFSVTPRVFDVA